MPNLAGTFDMRSNPADTSVFTTLLARVLDVPGVGYAVTSWRDQRFSAVNLLNGISGNVKQPATIGEDIVVFLDGEITNLDDVCGDSVNGGDGPDPTSTCLELYQRHGDAFVERLNGQFNILIYERQKHTVKIFNDRMGYRPFYYSISDGLALFGLEKKAIFAGLGTAATFDATGVFEFLAFGHNLDVRTVFDGVMSMRPGSILEIKDGQVSSRQYWRAAYTNGAGKLSCEDAAREFGKRLCDAVERQSIRRRRYGIFLSGGLDSRAVAGALGRSRDEVASFTFGSDDFPDFVYGRQLGEELGFALHRMRYENISFAELMPQVVWRTEGAIPFHQTISIAHHRRVRAEADVIFNGHHGGVLTGSHLMPQQLFVRDARQLAEHVLAKRAFVGLSELRLLFKPKIADEIYPEMVRGVERSLLSFGEDRWPLAYNLWDLTVREPHYTFCSPATERYIVEQVTPFTDNDVVEWMLSMPSRYLFGQRVYKRMIVQTFPEIANVPWAKTGRPIRSNFGLDVAKQAQLFVTKRLRRLGGNAQSPSVDPRLRSLEPFTTGDRIADSLPDEVFDRDGIRRVIRQALDGTGSTMPLFMLLTLVECAQLFGNGGLTEPPPRACPAL